MKRGFYPVSRALSVVALLLVTQLSYAAELCLSAAMIRLPAHTGNVGPSSENSQVASVGDALNRCPPGGTPQRTACIASPYDSGQENVVPTASFDPPSLPVAAGDAPGIFTAHSQTAALPKHAATPHPALRTLFCRYLI
ncbi:MAG TPA: hypothetical protein VF814_17570 [Casimicrobiaceae bacterium]